MPFHLNIEGDEPLQKRPAKCNVWGDMQKETGLQIAHLSIRSWVLLTKVGTKSLRNCNSETTSIACQISR